MNKFKTLLISMCAATLASISINAYANAGASYIYENLPKNVGTAINVVIQGDGATFVVESTNPYHRLWDQDDGMDPYLTNYGEDVSSKISSIGSNFGCKFTGNVSGNGLWIEGKCDR